VPSVTPISNKNDTLHEVKKKVKASPVCPSAPEGNPHHYSLHTLVSIHFVEETDTKTKLSRRICPSCTKELTNSSKATLAKPCGHVLCKKCVDQFMRPPGRLDPHAPDADPQGVRCYVCDADVTERKKSEKGGKKEKDKILPGLVELKSDGTGFSAGGVSEVKKAGVSFQA
jgi:nitric oxide synthase-interacting protein